MIIKLTAMETDIMMKALDGYQQKTIQHPADAANNDAIMRLRKQIQIAGEFNEVQQRLQQIDEERKKAQDRMAELQKAIRDCWE